MTAMPAAWQRPDHPPAPIDILIARAEARARLWQANLIEDLPAAVDPLWDYAVEAGLVAEHGADLVQDLLAQAFGPLRDDYAEIAEGETFESEGDERYCDTCGCAPCVNPSFCQACRAADAQTDATNVAPGRLPSTPHVVIEAIMHTVSARGPAALSEPANLERLGRCDAAALAEIDRRMSKS